MGLSARNKFAYPTGFTPGFNPNHPASFKARFSVVNMGLAAVNILTGLAGAANNYVQTVDSVIGPAQFSGNSTTQCSYTFSGGPTAAETQTTLACIMRMGPAVFNSVLLADSEVGTFNAGTWIQFNNLGYEVTVPPNGTSVPGINLVQGVPYFIGASIDSAGNYTSVISQLNTGQIIYTASGVTAHGIAATATTGKFYVGGDENASAGTAGSYAVAMKSGCFLSLAQWEQWALDPWSYWYPDEDASYPVSTIQPGTVNYFMPRAIPRIFYPGLGPSLGLSNRLAFSSVININLTGVSDITSAGTFGIIVQPGFGGAGSGSGGGTFVPGVTDALGSVSDISSAGIFTPGVTINLPGVSDPTSVGIFVPGVSIVVTGVSDSTAAGNFTIGELLTLSGVSDTSSSGNFAIVETTTGIGSSASTVGGSLTVSSFFIGVSSNTGIGSLTIGEATALLGASTSSGAGSLTAADAIALLGISTSSSVGSLLLSGFVSMIGVASSSGSGIFIPGVLTSISASDNSSIGLFLDSIAVNTLQGVLTNSQVFVGDSTGEYGGINPQFVGINIVSGTTGNIGHPGIDTANFTNLGTLVITVSGFFQLAGKILKARQVVLAQQYNPVLVKDGSQGLIISDIENLHPFLLSPVTSITPNPINFKVKLVKDGSQGLIISDVENLMPLLGVPVIVVTPNVVIANNITFQLNP